MDFFWQDFTACFLHYPLKMAASQSQVSEPLFLDIPYEKRWDLLKSVILRFYVEENYNTVTLAARMKEEYKFSATYVNLPYPDKSNSGSKLTL